MAFEDFGEFKKFRKENLKSFSDTLQERWSTSVEDLDVKNKELIKYMERFYEDNAPNKLIGSGKKRFADALWFKNQIFQIDMTDEEFFDYYHQGTRHGKRPEIDSVTGKSWMEYSENEIPYLFFSDDNTNGILWTNENIYVCGYIGGWGSHAPKRLSKSYHDISNFELKGGKLGTCTLIIDDFECNIGLSGPKQNREIVMSFMTGIISNKQTLLDKVESTQTQEQPVIVQSSEPDIATKIKQIKDLLDQGVLTEDEFNTKKQDLLDKM